MCTDDCINVGGIWESRTRTMWEKQKLKTAAAKNYLCHYHCPKSHSLSSSARSRYLKNIWRSPHGVDIQDDQVESPHGVDIVIVIVIIIIDHVFFCFSQCKGIKHQERTTAVACARQSVRTDLPRCRTMAIGGLQLFCLDHARSNNNSLTGSSRSARRPR